MSTANPDAELVARGERFEKFLLEYMDAWLEWAPLMRAARAQVGDDIAGAPAATRRKHVCQSLNVICSRSPRGSSPRWQHRSAGCALRRWWLSGRHFRRP